MAKGPLSPRPSVLLDVLKTAFFAAARIVVFFLFISLSLSRIRDGENRPHSERRRQSLPSVFSVEVNKVPWKEFSRQSSNNEKLSRKWHRYLFRRKIVRLFTKARKLEKRNLIAIVFFRSRHEPSSCLTAVICHRSSFSINQLIDRGEEKVVAPLLSYPKQGNTPRVLNFLRSVTCYFRAGRKWFLKLSDSINFFFFNNLSPIYPSIFRKKL